MIDDSSKWVYMLLLGIIVQLFLTTIAFLLGWWYFSKKFDKLEAEEERKRMRG